MISKRVNIHKNTDYAYLQSYNGISTLETPWAFSVIIFLALWVGGVLYLFTLFTLSKANIFKKERKAASSLCFIRPHNMKGSLGKSCPWPALKALSNKLGKMFFPCNSPNKYKRLDDKLERKMVEVKRSASGNSNFRSFDSIIMRFPQFKEGLKKIRIVFEQYDEDSNGAIDLKELKNCLQKLQVNLTDKEIDDLFHSCDIDGSEGIQFNEFIVLLCLIYLLAEPSTSSENGDLHQTSKVASPELEATFDTIVEAFLFLDKNGDGKLNKKDMVKALNEASPWEKSPAHVTRTRFKEMDWDKNGKVSFREFLFAFIDWVGIDSDD